MEKIPKVFIYKNGTRFEVTPDGLFYSPEKTCAPKKHNCHDCYFCLWCADSRCTLCCQQGDGTRSFGKAVPEEIP